MAIRPRRWPVALAVIVVLLAALILLWDWNWFRPLLEHQATVALGRQVTLGHFDVHLWRGPQLILDDVAIANPPDFPADSKTMTIRRLSIRIDGHALFRHRVHLSEIDIDHPVGELGLGPSGTPNWKLPGSTGKTPSAWQVEIGLLRISDGQVHFVDPQLKSDFRLTLHTQDQTQGQEPSIYVGIGGTYSGQPISGRFIGGSILSLRDPNSRYPVDLKLDHGATHVQLKGSVLDPLKFGGAALQLELAGDDLASLYPLTGIPLAPTPRYRLLGRLDYGDHKLRFRDFSGTVGDSDLEGNLEYDPTRERPYVTADMNSRRVVLADLAGFIGSAPGKEESPKQSPQHKAEHAQQEASGKALPDKPINLPKLRSTDLDVRYKAERIESQSAPLDRLSADLKVEDGVLTLHPLSFAIGQGHIVLNIRLSGEQDLVHAVADIDFRQVDLSRIMQSTGVFKGAGTIGGKASIDTTGNSLAQMLGRGNGALSLFMSGGDLSAVLVDLAGLDFGNGLTSALGLPNRTQLRCMVTDFGLDRGTLKTKLMLFDTTEANIVGDGDINLADEQVDYRLSTQPKHFSIGRIRAPILIRGPLKKPSIVPDPKALAARGGLAAALGALLTPLAALVPTIQLGLGKDHNCSALVDSVRSAGSTPQQEKHASQ